MIGIYQITNKINKKRYIGKSKHLTSRWQSHLNYLLKNKHVNKDLQDDFILYGCNNFTFEIIKECKPDELNICENYYIQLLNNDDYNIVGKQKIKPIKFNFQFDRLFNWISFLFIFYLYASLYLCFFSNNYIILSITTVCMVIFWISYLLLLFRKV